MRKSAFLLLTLIILLFLTACDPSSFKYKYDELTNNVIAIELIKYDNNKIKKFATWTIDQTSNLLAFKTENAEVLEKLSDEKLDGFFQDLAKCRILYKYFTYDSPKGICIKLTYDNGDFEILTCISGFSGYIGRYNINGDVVNFTGCFQNQTLFTNLVNNYFATTLDSFEKN